MKSKPKIIVLTPFYSPNLGGAETFTDDLVDLYLQTGYSVLVLTYIPLTNKRSAPLYVRCSELTVVRVPWPRGSFFYRFERHPVMQLAYLASGLAFTLLCASLLSIFRPKRVVALGLSALVAGRLAKLLVPRLELECVLLTIYRFAERPSISRVVSTFARGVDRFYCLSRSALEDLQAVEGVLHARAFELWIDQDRRFYPRSPTGLLMDPGRRAGARTALFVGRFSQEKGIDNLLELIAGRPTGWAFIVIGDGPMADGFDRATASLDNIRLRLRGVDNNELADFYSEADLLIFAPADRDYLGRTAIEALSCGTPVLIYDRSTYFGGAEPLQIAEDRKRGIHLVAPPLANVVEALEGWEDDRGRVSKDEIRSFAVKFFSKSNGECFVDH